MQRLIFLGTLLSVASFNVSAQKDVDILAESMMGKISDVPSWTPVAAGYHRGVSKDGVIVRLYTGASGGRLLLSKNEDKLTRLGSQTYKKIESGENSEADSLLARARQIEDENDLIREVISEGERSYSGGKAVQNINATALTCGYYSDMLTEFEATQSGSNYINIRARAEWGPFGEWMTGPPPAYPPYLARRGASAEALIYTDSTGFISDTSADVVAEASGPYAPSDCALWTRHVIQFRCESTSSLQLIAVEREQSCAGVIAGSPPVISF